MPSESAETQIKYFGAGLIDGQPYFVRVRVADNEGSAWSDWSAPLEFRMNTPPLINSVTPSAGTFDENILLAWNGTDAEGDKLAYSVMIYYDDSWHTVVDNGPVTEFNWFTDDIVPQTIVINVYASDGYENSSKFEPC